MSGIRFGRTAVLLCMVVLGAARGDGSNFGWPITPRNAALPSAYIAADYGYAQFGTLSELNDQTLGTFNAIISLLDYTFMYTRILGRVETGVADEEYATPQSMVSALYSPLLWGSEFVGIGAILGPGLSWTRVADSESLVSEPLLDDYYSDGTTYYHLGLMSGLSLDVYPGRLPVHLQVKVQLFQDLLGNMGFYREATVGGVLENEAPLSSVVSVFVGLTVKVGYRAKTDVFGNTKIEGVLE